jgi:hypothetical protein
MADLPLYKKRKIKSIKKPGHLMATGLFFSCLRVELTQVAKRFFLLPA